MKRYIHNNYKKLVLAATCLAVVGAALTYNVGINVRENQASSAPTLTGRTLILNENFNGTSLSSTWGTCYWYGCTNETNKELQYYTPQNIYVGNGALKLVGKKEEKVVGDKTYPYTSGMITSDTKFSFKYGYIEVRARTPYGRGLWPTVWMMPNDHSWPPELDVLEQVGHIPDTTFMGYHYKNDSGKDAYVQQTYHGPNFTTGFHTYGMEWKSGSITYYIDGVKRASYINRYNVTDKPMYVIANLAVGRQGVDEPDETVQFPRTLEIDYIRVWK